MTTGTLKLYKAWIATASPEEVTFVDEVYAICEKNYSRGGDTICECWTPEEVLRGFKTLDDVRTYCGLKVEQAMNSRWGEDTDPEMDCRRGWQQWED
jgi:hypothetical protein